MKKSNTNEKRLQSVAVMKKEYQRRKSIIKNALLSIDAKPKNKIIIADVDEHEDQTESSSSSKQRLTLFDEDQDEEKNYNFDVVEHFQDERGENLWKLQSKFKNDKRFKMDARFMEDDKPHNDESETLPVEAENEEISQDDEQQKQLQILNEVLGNHVAIKSSKIDKLLKSKKNKMMIHFDPTNPDHVKNDTKELKKEKKKRKSSKEVDNNIGDDTRSTVEETTIPEVSKDTFYKIAVDLKTALHEKESFSLAEMFSKNIENVPEDEEEYLQDTATTNKKPRLFSHEENPFQYDSSDSEDEKKDKNDSELQETTISSQPQTSLRSNRAWTEPFFFKPDDYRLQEGWDFIKRMAAEELDDFHKVRRNLKQIVRAKVKNNQRKNRAFKKKLGGKKRIKVKRALKR